MLHLAVWALAPAIQVVVGLLLDASNEDDDQYYESYYTGDYHHVLDLLSPRLLLLIT